MKHGPLPPVLTAFLTTRLILFIVIFFSMTTIPLRPGQNLYASPGNLLLDGLVRHDSWWYHNIVTTGYSMGDIATGQQGNVAFFPLYPLLVKGMAALTDNVFLAGVIVSNVAFIVALLYLYLLTAAEFDEETAGRTVFYYAAAPASLFFSAMYTEGLYMALVIATFYYARRGAWPWAALTGALAAATRNTGILLLGVLVLEGVHQQGWRFWPMRAWRQWPQQLWRSWRGVVAGLFVLVGLLAYMSYLNSIFGEPFGFITVQATWGRQVSSSGLSSLPATALRDMGLGTGFWAGRFNPVAVWDLGFALLFLLLIGASARRLRPAHVAFCLLTFLIPLSTGTVASMTRYVLMLFPCYMLLGVWGRRPWVDRLVVGLSLPLLAYFGVLFSHWYFAG